MIDPRAPAAGISFADLLRGHRISAALTQEALAEQAGISARAISDIERGLRLGVYRDTAKRLAEALHLDEPERSAFERAARRPAGARQRWPTATAGGHAPGAVPSPLTRLIGREAELDAAVGALAGRTVRVLTIVGPAGVGKTRLAIEVANRAGMQFQDRAHLVQLAVTRDPALVAALIAREVGLTSVRKPLPEALRDYLSGREMLLVLDTFEHVPPAAAFIAELATACPRLALLITSRRALNIRGEHELPLEPLAVPPPGADLGAIEGSPAVTLFLERARAVRPDLALDRDTTELVADICRRLEGLPLALELAAVGLRHMPLAALRLALDRRLKVLVAGPRDLPPRLQTMRGAIAWSHELLSPRAQQLFRALSVFAGGWTPAAAEALWTADADGVVDEMATLLDNHLIAVDFRDPGGHRFRMLDIIREFAAEQAGATAEADQLAARHAMYFVDLAEAAEREQAGPDQESWYRRLQVEADNLRAALEHAAAYADGSLVLRLAGALWLFWRRNGDYAEARRWLDQALGLAAGDDGAADRSRRRKVLWGDAWISYYQGDYSHVRRLGEELLRLAEDDADPVGIRNGLTVRALVTMANGHFDDAVELLEECVRICRESCPPWLLATSLLVLGQATLHGTGVARSRAVLGEARSIYARLGDRLFVAWTDGYLGYASLLAGNPSAARRLFASSLREFNSLGERFGIAEELLALATVAAAEEHDGRAAVLAGAANAVWASMSAQPLASDRPIGARFLDPARRRLGSAAWRAAYRRGVALDSAGAVRLALGRSARGLRRHEPVSTSARGSRRT